MYVTHVIKKDESTFRDTKTWVLYFKNPCKFKDVVSSEFQMTFSDST